MSRSVLKYLIALCWLMESKCFISPSVTPIKLRSMRSISLQAKNSNFTESVKDVPAKNTSKIMKINFSDNLYEEDDLFEPKYAFGLSEFDMLMLRIGINLTIITYFYTMLTRLL